jgi:hypothetical protein
MTFSVDSFLAAFLSPPSGSTPQDIISKIRHQIDVVNHPEEHSSDTSIPALRAKRRNARQSLRRLVLKHPEIAAQIMREHKAEASQ